MGVVDLAGEGSMEGSSVFDFAFEGVEKIHESYNGINARLRYFVRITVGQKYGDIVKESDIWVINYSSAPEDNRGIKMEVGISECLHIEIEYVSTKHNLQDVVIGKIYFLLSRIKVKHMAVSLVRRETVAVGKEHVLGAQIPLKVRDHGRRTRQRRVHPRPHLSRRLPAHPNLPQGRKQVLPQVLPLPRNHRRRRQEVL